MSVTTLPRPSRHAASALAGGLTLFLRRLRLEPMSALTMFVLVAGATFLFAALPRLFNQFADDGLRFAVEHAAAPARQVRVTDTGRVPDGRVDAHAAASQQVLPASLRALIDRQGFVVTSPLFILEADRRPTGTSSGTFRFVTLRHQPGVRPHVRLVAGRFPGASTERVQAPVSQPVLQNRSAPPIPGLPKTRSVPLVEVALSTATARALRLKLGDRAVFTPELQDPAVQLVPIRDELPLAIHVAGLFAVDHPNDQFWFGDTGLGTPTIRQSQSLDENNVFAQALISDAGYKTMLAATRPLLLNYDSHYVVRPDRVDARHIGPLTADLARLQSEFSGATQLDRQVQVALSPVLEQYRKERSQAETLLSVAAIGLFACALACLGLLAALSYDRRRNETELSRTRGASPHHLLAAQAAESFLISAPAALLGWGLAVLLVDGRGSSLSAWLAFAIVAATVLLPVLAIAGTARRPLGARAREDVVTGTALGAAARGGGAGRRRRRCRRLPAAPARPRLGRHRRVRPLSRRRAGAARPRLRDPRVAALPAAARRAGAGCAARARAAAAPGAEQGGAAAGSGLAAADRARPRARDRDVRGRDGAHARRGAGSLELARDRRRPAGGRRARRRRCRRGSRRSSMQSATSRRRTCRTRASAGARRRPCCSRSTRPPTSASSPARPRR